MGQLGQIGIGDWILGVESEERVLRRNTPVLGIHWCGKRESLGLVGISGFLD